MSKTVLFRKILSAVGKANREWMLGSLWLHEPRDIARLINSKTCKKLWIFLGSVDEVCNLMLWALGLLKAYLGPERNKGPANEKVSLLSQELPHPGIARHWENEWRCIYCMYAFTPLTILSLMPAVGCRLALCNLRCVSLLLDASCW